MFELGRELKRLFKPVGGFAAPREGLTGGDLSLTELLDIDMLRAEAKACDVAAGRIGAKDRPLLHLRRAAVWRELARRTGEEAALRKAAAAAETALGGLDHRKTRLDTLARARLEQASCAMLSVELGGDPGLAAAARAALSRADELAEAQVLIAQIDGAEALLRGEPQTASDAAQAAGVVAEGLERNLRERPARRRAALARLACAELLAAVGRQQRDEAILTVAMDEAVRSALVLDTAYEPVTWSRASILHGEILAAVGEMTGDAAPLESAVQVLTAVFEHLRRDHSPLDWAACQYRLGRALASLAEVVGNAEMLEQARTAFDRALVVLNTIPSHPLRAAAAQAKGGALCRQAELTSDRLALDGAEAAFRCELAVADPQSDPVAWAVCQTNLAHIYLARLAMTGKDKGERVKAAIALDAAIEVFAEQGLKVLADAAAASLQRVRARV